MLSDGRREIRKSGIVELLAGLPPIGLDIRDRKGYGTAALFHRIFRKKGLQPFPQPTFFRCHRLHPFAICST